MKKIELQITKIYQCLFCGNIMEVTFVRVKPTKFVECDGCGKTAPLVKLVKESK